jgi:hypothetical protein
MRKFTPQMIVGVTRVCIASSRLRS